MFYCHENEESKESKKMFSVEGYFKGGGRDRENVGRRFLRKQNNGTVAETGNYRKLFFHDNEEFEESIQLFWV